MLRALKTYFQRFNHSLKAALVQKDLNDLPPIDLTRPANQPGEFGDVGVVGKLRRETLGADEKIAQAGPLRPRAAAAAQDFGVLRDDIQLIAERGLVKGRR
jgi:hypothetical protein